MCVPRLRPATGLDGSSSLYATGSTVGSAATRMGVYFVAITIGSSTVAIGRSVGPQTVSPNSCHQLGGPGQNPDATTHRIADLFTPPRNDPPTLRCELGKSMAEFGSDRSPYPRGISSRAALRAAIARARSIAQARIPRKDPRMTRQFGVTIDCLHPATLAPFWCDLLGYIEDPPPNGYQSWRDYDLANGVSAAEAERAQPSSIRRESSRASTFSRCPNRSGQEPSAP